MQAVFLFSLFHFSGKGSTYGNVKFFTGILTFSEITTLEIFPLKELFANGYKPRYGNCAYMFFDGVTHVRSGLCLFDDEAQPVTKYLYAWVTTPPSNFRSQVDLTVS